jgi:hypothetical protein
MKKAITQTKTQKTEQDEEKGRNKSSFQEESEKRGKYTRSKVKEELVSIIQEEINT